MTPRRWMRVSAASAVLSGFVLRLFFVLRFPMTQSGDAPLYAALAENWLTHRIYGIPINGSLAPVDIRVPGYPAFLAAIFAVFGNAQLAVLLVQAVIGTAVCVLVALIAARLAPPATRRRVALAALWLAALCPFTANYAAVMQTETLAIFLTAIIILLLLQTEIGESAANPIRVSSRPWFLAGMIAGVAALVRPETPLILIAAALAIAWKWRRATDYPKLLRSVILLAAGLAIALAPWAARNWRTLHKIQFLAPRYGELPDEIVPRGFNAWIGTWLWRMRDVYLFPWKLDSEQLSITDVPSSAFDSAEERSRVAAIFDRYNETLTLDSTADDAFREIARQRTTRHPLRTYVEIPALRALTLWFSPRIELLPVSGRLFPLRSSWDQDRPDLLVTLAALALACFYIFLGVAGASISRASPGWLFLVLFLVIRTAFFACFVETPEPRYVLECFPALIALAAQVWSKSAVSKENRSPARQASPVGSA